MTEVDSQRGKPLFPGLAARISAMHPTVRLTAFLLLIVAFMGGAALLKGGFYPRKHEGDTLQLADIVLRMAEGQWPHLDFMTPIGVLAMAPIAWFVKAGAGLGHAIFYAQILVALVLLPAAVHVARSRLPGGWGWLHAGFVMVLCLALVHGETERSVSISMHYNRWAWALAYLAVPLALLEPAGRARPALDGAIVGLCVAALALIKVTFLIALAPGLFVALVARRQWLGMIVGAAAGLAVAGVVTALAGVAFWGAYLSDLMIVAASKIRPQPGDEFWAIVTAPAWLAGTLAILAAVIFLRQAGRKVEGLALLVLMPGFLYIVYQNYGNDPQWLILLAVLALVLRPAPGLLNEVGIDLRAGLTTVGIVTLTLGAGSAVNLLYSPLRHLAVETKDTRPLIPAMAQHGDIRALKERVYGVNNVVPGDGDGSGYEAFRGDAERKNIAKLNGEVLPDCEQQTGMSALFTAMSRDLEAAGYAGKRVLAADLFTLFWMFGDFQPVKGAAPWYYGGVPGVENADLIVVPLCPIAKNVRAEMLKALEESGRTLTVVRRTPLYVAIETSRD